MFPYIMTQYTKMTNKMQLCRIIYYSLAALHLSSDIFAHHQEHLNCITASGITHYVTAGWYCQHSHDTYLFRAIFLLIIRSIETVLQLLVLHTISLPAGIASTPVIPTCFERYFRLSSGASKLYYSFWYYTLCHCRLVLPTFP